MAVHSMLSSDDGLTWGSRAEVYNPTGNREAGAPQVANVGGTAVAIFMSNEAGTFSGVDGGELKVRTSTDRGASWSAAVVASGLGTHWPGIHVLNDNEFLLLYSFTGQGLVSRRFTK
jgi:hypothetical protein